MGLITLVEKCILKFSECLYEKTFIKLQSKSRYLFMKEFFIYNNSTAKKVDDKLLESNDIRIYSVNSHIMREQINFILQQHPQHTINRVCILVRKKTDETKEDLDTLNSEVDLWRKMRNNGKIAQLDIRFYKSDIDFYFTVLGDSMCLLGTVRKNKDMPTQTEVSFNPTVFTSQGENGKKVINSLIEKFDELWTNNENNTFL